MLDAVLHQAVEHFFPTERPLAALGGSEPSLEECRCEKPHDPGERWPVFGVHTAAKGRNGRDADDGLSCLPREHVLPDGWGLVPMAVTADRRVAEPVNLMANSVASWRRQSFLPRK